MIIGLSGKRCSGKNVVADYLEKRYNFKQYSFANKIKDIGRDVFFWDGIKDEKGRKLLQDIGLQMRNIDKNVWVNYILKNIDFTNSLIHICITDVRFINEVQLITDCGGKIWRIERNIERKSELDNHLSEMELDNYKVFNEVIENNGTFEELYEKIDKIMKWR